MVGRTLRAAGSPRASPSPSAACRTTQVEPLFRELEFREPDDQHGLERVTAERQGLAASSRQWTPSHELFRASPRKFAPAGPLKFWTPSSRDLDLRTAAAVLRLSRPSGSVAALRVSRVPPEQRPREVAPTATSPSPRAVGGSLTPPEPRACAGAHAVRAHAWPGAGGRQPQARPFQ